LASHAHTQPLAHEWDDSADRLNRAQQKNWKKFEHKLNQQASNLPSHMGNCLDRASGTAIVAGGGARERQSERAREWRQTSFLDSKSSGSPIKQCTVGTPAIQSINGLHMQFNVSNKHH